MKVVHFANWAPRRSGMYESTKDQIKYERREGLESDFVDPHEVYKNGKPDFIDDGWLSPVAHGIAEKADIWVMHSYIPESLKPMFNQKITVAVLHGPSEHMLLKEWTSGRKEAAFNLHINILWKYDATIVLNKHEKDIMELYDEHDRLHYIPNSIDIERYSSEGFVWEYEKHPAIISCDVPRLEKLPAHVVWAMPEIVKRIPNARLSLFSLPLEPISTFRNIFCRSKLRNLEKLCETIQLENRNLKPFMAGADIGFNNNISGIASRVSMEFMAMGVPVISYGGDYTPYIAKIWSFDSIAEQVERCWKDLSIKGSRLKKFTAKYAADNFDRAKEVKKYVELYKKLMEKKNG